MTATLKTLTWASSSQVCLINIKKCAGFFMAIFCRNRTRSRPPCPYFLHFWVWWRQLINQWRIQTVFRKHTTNFVTH